MLGDFSMLSDVGEPCVELGVYAGVQKLFESFDKDWSVTFVGLVKVDDRASVGVKRSEEFGAKEGEEVVKADLKSSLLGHGAEIKETTIVVIESVGMSDVEIEVEVLSTSQGLVAQFPYTSRIS